MEQTKQANPPSGSGPIAPVYDRASCATSGCPPVGRQLECRSGSVTPISQLDHFEAWRVVHLGHLDELVGVMATTMGLPIESADRIRTQPSPFRPA